MVDENHHKVSKDLRMAVNHINFSISLFGAALLLTALPIALEFVEGTQKFEFVFKWIIMITLIGMGLYVIYLSFKIRRQNEIGDEEI